MKERIYWRAGRAWADFRDYADVGGKQEALRVKGDKHAITDPELAEVMRGQRLEQLNKLRTARQGRVIHGQPEPTSLKVYADHHLVEKAKAGKVTDRWLEENEHFLERAVAHFGADRDLTSITPKDVSGWSNKLLQTPPTRRKSGTMSPGTVRHHLNALSNLYVRARSEGVVVSGYDPVGDMLEKPAGSRTEAAWLEVPDAALLLESARLHDAEHAYPLVATFLLTGGREAEVLGLEVDDVSLERGTITFRPNKWRRLKTKTSHRTVPLWPQLRQILRAYFPVRERMGDGTLLFPSYRTGSEAMATDFRKLLDRVAERAGWKEGEIRSKRFRHTYISARLQTTDHGASVAMWTVAREVGHSSTEMIERVYAHLGTVRHRAKAVEYRVSQHKKALGERVQRLREAIVNPRV